VRKLLSSRRGRVLVVCAVVAMVFGGGGAAFAYFTSTGSGTGSATVGQAATWDVTQTSTTGTIYPGSGASTIVFNVKNVSNGDQSYATSAVAVNSSGGDITVNGTPVSGCQASWFNASVSNDAGAGTNIAAGGSASVTVSVSMPSNATTNQDACEGQSPDVTLTVN
jgi:hypothetical protein